jgi:hypothetical protein
MRWQQNFEQTLTEKKVASVASLNQSVQHEKKKSEPTLSQKHRECLIAYFILGKKLLKLKEKKIVTHHG